MISVLLKGVNELELSESPMPECGQEEAILKIVYAGICGSDMHLVAGENSRAKIPLIPGHECCAIVKEIKSNRILDIKPGDKVTAHAVNGCGICKNCRNGHENLCRNVKIMGTEIDGFFQEYVKVKADRLIKFDDDVDMIAAALVEPLTIGVHDVIRAGVEAGDDVFVCGAGTIGTLIAAVAKLQGGRVLMSEFDDNRIRMAKERGFNVVDRKNPDFMDECSKFTRGELFDKVFEVTGVESGFKDCLDMFKPGATLVQVGMPGKKFSDFDINKIIFNEINFLGVRNSRSFSMQTAVKLVNDGVLNDLLKGMVTEIYPKEKAIEAFERARTDKSALKILINFGT